MLPERHDLATTDDLKTEIGAAKDELRAEIGAAKDELRAEIGAAKDELRAEIGVVRQEVAGLRGEMQKYVRTFVISQTTAIVGVAGIVFAIVRLG